MLPDSSLFLAIRVPTAARFPAGKRRRAYAAGGAAGCAEGGHKESLQEAGAADAPRHRARRRLRGALHPGVDYMF